MKSHKYLLLPLVLAFSSFGPFDPPATRSVLVSTSLIGPHDVNGIEQETISLTNKTNALRQLNLIVGYQTTFSEVKLIFASQHKGYGPNESKTFNFKINYTNIPNIPITYVIVVKNELNKEILRLTQKVSDSEATNEEITDAKRMFNVGTYGFEIKNNNKNIYKEQFDFTYFPSNLYANKYLYLPIGGTFYYKGTDELTYGNAFISFIDEKDLFKSCQTNSQKVVEIPLTLVTYGHTIYIFVKNEMYVHPQKLTMSFTKKEGYVKTKKFYLPHNQSKTLQNYSFSYNFVGLGVKNTSFMQKMTYQNDHYLLGECHNSDYCVISGVGDG